ncbi:hypothetical protein PybrP1_010288 [[Pythium] brassicae (nom. inval.)]|nr:hypothetical protein PybrP1_010288 [[Pythium] brassicae (nom. inval.)]
MVKQQQNGAPAPKVSLTIEEKQALIAKAEQEPTWSQSVLAKWATTTFQLYTPLNRTTVSKILLRAEEIKSADEFFLKRYNVTRPQFPALEQELVEWIVTVRKQGAGVTGAMIQAEAANIAARQAVPKDKFKCSNGWLERFQNRYRDEIENTLREYAEATGAPIATLAPTGGRRGGGGSVGGAAGGKRVGAKKAPGVGKRAGKKVPQRAGGGLTDLKQTADAIMDIVGDIGASPGFDRSAMLGSDPRGDMGGGAGEAANEMLKSEMLAYTVGYAGSQAAALANSVALVNSQVAFASSVGLVNAHAALANSVHMDGASHATAALSSDVGLVPNVPVPPAPEAVVGGGELDAGASTITHTSDSSSEGGRFGHPQVAEGGEDEAKTLESVGESALL